MRIIWFLVLFCPVLSEYGINKPCVTPHGDLGICTGITSCHLFEQYKKLPNKAAKQKYVSQSSCGVRHKIPLVCCGPPEKNISDECGIIFQSKNSNRASQNHFVEEHFPWMVALQYKENDKFKFACAGFLINSRFILTAAHCLKGEFIYNVYLGISNLTNFKHEGIKARVMNISYPDAYRDVMDDVGLIMIEPMKYSENIRWICLPKKVEVLPNWYTLRGWGKNNRMIEAFTIVLENRYKIEEYGNCATARRRNVMMDSVICATGENMVDSCDGDSGGALMNYTESKGWTAFGIVSSGSRNCSAGFPSVYTRVQYYLDWVEKEMLQMLTHHYK